MKIFKTFFITAIIALFIGGGFFLTQKKVDNSDQFVRKRDGLLRLINNARDLRRIWYEGEDSREWALVKSKCLNKYSITEYFDESLIRCHPMVIECVNNFLDKKTFIIKNSTFQYPTYVYTLEDLLSKETLKVSLSDQCHELYLEPKVYSYGEAPAKKVKLDYQFDLLNRHIYFDQHLVTNSEVNEWIKYDESVTQNLKMELIGNNLFLPASNLTLRQMQNYCSFKGKQLMLAHVFDAATFLTQEKNRSPYYWTKKNKEVDFGCDLIFTEECLAEKKWKINSASPSWAGLYDALGGVPEVFRNPVDPESNLKASSFYFSKKSGWHRLGFRAHWDGEGNTLRNFDFKGINPNQMENNYQVGFRCMREASL